MKNYRISVSESIVDYCSSPLFVYYYLHLFYERKRKNFIFQKLPCNTNKIIYSYLSGDNMNSSPYL